MIDFPNSPTDGQIFSAPNGVVYKYSATYSSWLAQNPTPPLGGTGDFCANQTSGFPTLTASYATLILTQVMTGNSGLWYSTSTGRYTPPAGRYTIDAGLSANFAGASAVGIVLRKNGTVLIEDQDTASTASNRANPKISLIVDANGADWFDIQGVSSAGAPSFVYNMTFQASPLTGMQGPTGLPGAGKLLQTVNVETGAVATGTTVIPFADTIPTNTQGDQYMTLSITPQSATSTLIIDVLAYVSNSVATASLIIALFQDVIVNALAVGTTVEPSAGGTMALPLRHKMISGTTSSTSFKVRIGGNAAGTTTFNGSGGARFFGGALASSITIQEVLP